MSDVHLDEVHEGPLPSLNLGEHEDDPEETESLPRNMDHENVEGSGGGCPNQENQSGAGESCPINQEMKTDEPIGDPETDLMVWILMIIEENNAETPLSWLKNSDDVVKMYHEYRKTVEIRRVRETAKYAETFAKFIKSSERVKAGDDTVTVSTPSLEKLLSTLHQLVGCAKTDVC